jgi:hypothetical protein
VAVRSYSDVPNRVVHLFLQEAGVLYDRARGLPPFRRLVDTLAFFDGRCAYCGAAGVQLVEEHAIPRNRLHAGLHAWGNVVPACTACNRRKGARPWTEYFDELEAAAPDDVDVPARRACVARFVDHHRYEPDVEQLQAVIQALYEHADAQTRSMIRFAVTSAALALDGMVVAREPAQRS